MGTRLSSSAASRLINDATIRRAKKKMPLGVMAQWATALRRQARDDALILIVLIQGRASKPHISSFVVSRQHHRDHHGLSIEVSSRLWLRSASSHPPPITQQSTVIYNLLIRFANIHFASLIFTYFPGFLLLSADFFFYFRPVLLTTMRSLPGHLPGSRPSFH